VGGDICAPCCGSEREITVDCPLDCEYLREARKHEKMRELSDDDFPNKDIRVTEPFLNEHGPLLDAVARSLVTTALAVPGAIDADARDALASLIRTYRTLQSGLVYETRPSNPMAGYIHHAVQTGVEEFRREMRERAGISAVRDSEVLGILVFLERLGIQFDNGRRRGRAFLDHLAAYFSPQAQEGSSPLIVP
jgi:hypothetical protein